MTESSDKLQQISRVGTPFIYLTVAGLCGMAASAIWSFDVGWRISATVAACSGIITALFLVMYSGQKGLDEKKQDTSR